MSKPRFHRRARIAVALSAAAALAISGAVIASSGSAKDTPNTLNLIAKNQKKVGFFPHHKPHQGDRFGFGDKVSGDDTGIDRAVCTVIGKQILCNIQARLSNGNISLQGFIPKGAPHNLPIAVTGGTGAYDGEDGTAVVSQINQSKTRITINFAP